MLVSELLAGLTAKLAGLGLAAKATLGLGIATVAVTGAGAANVLPDPAQHAVATVVNAVSPLELSDPNLAVDLDATTKVSVPDLLEDALGDELGDDEGDGNGSEAKDNHGACVSAVAKNKDDLTTGREHGLAVSTMAKSDCGKEDKTPLASSDTSSTTTSTTVDASTASELDESDKGKGKSGEDSSGPSENRGPGSNNSGSNSGRGNSGK